MAWIKTGWLVDTLVFIVLVAVLIYMLYIAKKGKIFKLRELPAIVGIRDGIGRAVEMNKPVHFSPTAGMMLSGDWATQTVAAISILSYVSRVCANLNARLLVSYSSADWAPMVEDAYKSGFIAEGKADQIRLNDLHLFIGGSFNAAAMKRIVDEKPGVVINVGAVVWDSIDIGETAKRVGAIMIGGTARLLQLPYVVLTSDYVFIGEELYAAGAYSSGDPGQINTIAGQDFGKWLFLALLVIGYVFLVAGISISSWLSI